MTSAARRPVIRSAAELNCEMHASAPMTTNPSGSSSGLSIVSDPGEASSGLAWLTAPPMAATLA